MKPDKCAQRMRHEMKRADILEIQQLRQVRDFLIDSIKAPLTRKSHISAAAELNART
jgi:hypothetical protein